LSGNAKALFGRLLIYDFICCLLNIQEPMLRFSDSLNKFFYFVHFA